MSDVFGDNEATRLVNLQKQTIDLLNESEIAFRRNAGNLSDINGHLCSAVRAYHATRAPNTLVGNAISIPASIIVFQDNNLYGFNFPNVANIVVVFVERNCLMISYHVDELVIDERHTVAPGQWPHYRFRVDYVPRRYTQAVFYDLTHVVLENSGILPLLMFKLDPAMRKPGPEAPVPQVSGAAEEEDMEGSESADDETDVKPSA